MSLTNGQIHLLSKEMLRLQGIPSEVAELGSAMGISDSEIGAAAGNAWAVPLISAILNKIKASMSW